MAEANRSADENVIFLINCSRSLKTEDFLKEIIGEDFISSYKIFDNTTCYPWKIDNKYYNAEVTFMVASEEEKDKVKSVSGLVVVFDCKKETFDLVKQWLPFIESHSPSVLLLVSSKCNADENALSKLEVLQWCLKHSFEFIDLDEEVDVEDDFPDSVGFDRVIQALQTTEWPDLQLKSDKPDKTAKIDTNTEKFPLLSNENEKMLNSTDKSNIALPNGSTHSNNKTTDKNSVMADVNTFSEVYESLSNPELNDGDSFDQLFSQMSLMKEKASSLPISERKDYAEQVAIAFWRAIGGDEEEIEDLAKTTQENNVQ